MRLASGQPATSDGHRVSVQLRLDCARADVAACML
jgi:hypothetical protein